ncbi:MAG: 3-oxoacyl-ACP synthase III [Opitutales bacterium]|nr:3-oxoacyl-ACP synthase III [Opitutales bacterium]MCH8540809.1 3-oxoacyl-ACP synthase III [Opitutales bacterium]
MPENAVVESIQAVVPREVLTTEDMEKRLAPLYERLRLPEGRLELMTGIQERRFWPKGTRASEASTQAGRAVLEKSSFTPEEIDLVIHCAVCRDRLEPATAAYVHGELGLSSQTGFMDVSNACLGFLNGMHLANGLIASGQARRVLLVAGENGRPLVENTLAALLDPQHTRKSIKPFFANLTIGCGAVGAILCRRDLCPEGSVWQGGAFLADSRYNRLCEGDSAEADGLAMQTDSEELLVAGVDLAKRTWDAFTESTGWSAERLDHSICHQVGAAHRAKLYETLGLAREKDFSTFPFLGNIGSVSLPLTLAWAAGERNFGAGDKIALLGIGSGISCQMAALEWGAGTRFGHCEV